jgi:hypothetical protein
MVWTTYRRHLPALLIMIVAAGLWLLLLSRLPDPMIVRCAFSQAPVFDGEPIIPLAAMAGFMLVSHAVIVIIDFLFFAPAVPGYIMAATGWIVEGVTAVFYLSILGAGLSVLPCVWGLSIGAVGMFVILSVIYRRARESVERAAGPLFNSAYYERVGPALMTRVFFFLRPLFPSYIIVDTTGVRIIGILYDVTYPWGRIDRVKKGDFFTFFSNRPIKLNQRLTNTVEIRLKGRKVYPLISVADRDRFLGAAARFMTGGGETAPDGI